MGNSRKKEPLRELKRKYKSKVQVMHSNLREELEALEIADKKGELTIAEYNEKTLRAVIYWRNCWIRFCKSTQGNTIPANVHMFDSRIGYNPPFNIWKWIVEKLFLWK